MRGDGTDADGLALAVVSDDRHGELGCAHRERITQSLWGREKKHRNNEKKKSEGLICQALRVTRTRACGMER